MEVHPYSWSSYELITIHPNLNPVSTWKRLSSLGGALFFGHRSSHDGHRTASHCQRWIIYVIEVVGTGHCYLLLNTSVILVDHPNRIGMDWPCQVKLRRSKANTALDFLGWFRRVSKRLIFVFLSLWLQSPRHVKQKESRNNTWFSTCIYFQINMQMYAMDPNTIWEGTWPLSHTPSTS